MKNNVQRYAKGFYSALDVSRAVKDYKRIATITLYEEKDYYVCKFSNCITDPRRVVLEFNNYLIELMNSRGAKAEA